MLHIVNDDGASNYIMLHNVTHQTEHLFDRGAGRSFLRMSGAGGPIGSSAPATTAAAAGGAGGAGGAGPAP